MKDPVNVMRRGLQLPLSVAEVFMNSRLHLSVLPSGLSSRNVLSRGYDVGVVRLCTTDNCVTASHSLD